ncbi:MAG: response regulator transcription factor [Lachnospiraceae bacterium]|nr:response regulator transcription factor [Lachnospiraceae bacterium]
MPDSGRTKQNALPDSGREKQNALPDSGRAVSVGLSVSGNFSSDALPELVILDIMLPGMDGVEVLRRLRKNPETAQIPVIMATAKGTEVDKIQSLDLGADDYLVKPFGMMEMVSRVKAVLRRCAPVSAGRLLRAGNLVVNLDEHSVLAEGQPVSLTLKEYDLLVLFLQNPGMVFSREQLMSRVWDTDYLGETRTVDMHIRTLRQKLGACSDCIETVRGVGYRMRK